MSWGIFLNSFHCRRTSFPLFWNNCSRKLTGKLRCKTVFLKKSTFPRDIWRTSLTPSQLEPSFRRWDCWDSAAGQPTSLWVLEWTVVFVEVLGTGPVCVSEMPQFPLQLSGWMGRSFRTSAYLASLVAASCGSWDLDPACCSNYWLGNHYKWCDTHPTTSRPFLLRLRG